VKAFRDGDRDLSDSRGILCDVDDRDASVWSGRGEIDVPDSFRAEMDSGGKLPRFLRLAGVFGLRNFASAPPFSGKMIRRLGRSMPVATLSPPLPAEPRPAIVPEGISLPVVAPSETVERLSVSELSLAEESPS
jgi:hypothetical protein